MHNTCREDFCFKHKILLIGLKIIIFCNYDLRRMCVLHKFIAKLALRLCLVLKFLDFCRGIFFIKRCFTISFFISIRNDINRPSNLFFLRLLKSLLGKRCLIVFKLFFLNLIDFRLQCINFFLFVLFNQLKIVLLFLLLVSDDAVLVSILRNDLTNAGISCNIQYCLALTVLNMD